MASIVSYAAVASKQPKVCSPKDGSSHVMMTWADVVQGQRRDSIYGDESRYRQHHSGDHSTGRSTRYGRVRGRKNTSSYSKKQTHIQGMKRGTDSCERDSEIPDTKFTKESLYSDSLTTGVAVLRRLGAMTKDVSKTIANKTGVNGCRIHLDYSKPCIIWTVPSENVDMMPIIKDAVSTLINDAKKEIRSQSFRRPYLPDDNDNFLLYTHGAEPVEYFSYFDARGILVFADKPLDDKVILQLSRHGEIIYMQHTDRKKNEDRNKCATRCSDTQAAMYCKIIFREVSTAELVCRLYEVPTKDYHFYVKSMKKPSEEGPASGGVVTCYVTARPAIRELRLEASQLRDSASCMGGSGSQFDEIRVYGRRCPVKWMSGSFLSASVDVSSLPDRIMANEKEIIQKIESIFRSRSGIRYSLTEIRRKREAVINGRHKSVAKALIAKYFPQELGRQDHELCESEQTTPLAINYELLFRSRLGAESFFNDEAKMLVNCHDGLKVKCLFYWYFNSLNISSEIASAVRRDIQRLKETTFETCGDEVCIDRMKSDNGEVQILVKGMREEGVQKAFRTLQNTVEGVVLKLRSIHAKALVVLSTKSGQQFVSGLEQHLGVHIKFHQHQEKMTIYGDMESKTTAEALITDFIRKQTELFVVIPLDEYMPYTELLEILVKKYGFHLEALAKYCDIDDIWFDFKEKSLHAFGSDESVHKLRSVIEYEASHADELLLENPRGNVHPCVSCFCDIRHCKMTLSLCGHTYCAACFYSQLIVTLETNTYPMCCAAPGCSERIVFADVEKVIGGNPANLLWFSTKSLSSLGSRRVPYYSQCPGTDCPMVYHTSAHGDDTKVTCPACMMTLCRTCKSTYHEGMSCKMHRFRFDAKLMLGVWLEEDSVNRSPCPNCGEGIEKNGGCNRLTCGKCRVHICWVCKATFSTSGDAYNHLRVVHGKIF